MIQKGMKLHDLPHSRKLTKGQKSADFISKWGGSWHFISLLAIILIVWMTLNVVLVIKYKWDPYPFILLNLFLSFLAAFQAPVILMSQNRESERDRKRSLYDYEINRKAEREIENMQEDLNEIKRMIRSLKRK